MKKICIFAIQHSCSGDLRLNNYIHTLSKKYELLVIRNETSYLDSISKIKKFKPDLFHLHDMISYIIFYVFFRNNKYIIDYHEYYHKKEYQKTFSLIGKVVIKTFCLFIKNNFDNNANYVVGAVDGITKEIKNKKATIYNFPLYTKEKKQRKNKELTLVYVGRVSIEKGSEKMFDIFNKIKQKTKNVKLHMIGSIKDKNNILYDKNIIYHNQIKTEDVKKILDKSHFGFVLLNNKGQHNYALPIKVFEYLKSRLVVCCSELKYLHKFIGENTNMFFSNDSKLISEKILKLFNNKVLYNQTSKKSYSIHKQKYNWSTEEKKILHIYSEILNK